jgi:hypothetical protein
MSDMWQWEIKMIRKGERERKKLKFSTTSRPLLLALFFIPHSAMNHAGFMAALNLTWFRAQSIIGCIYLHPPITLSPHQGFSCCPPTTNSGILNVGWASPTGTP